ncbi:MAG: GDP-fucose synthetase [Deltaproteobacteria bacterium CG_4_10_14_3_um_filter_60_8]|nr:MAG: GDP-fucose synthetase [Desulfobacterales bacterium CG2_30_60_27]PIP43143.1 MAG: GDP-fucose synthetase [Deltaproteobacteria bacterium CG23_combo_of_CG06-09_8_20_14_all_60_8]PIY24401.1 MAG: GDP-fucose synthetase [Deltaproteobacteria bacterium CG_4_10_14_3_um_filter_60_8]
MEKNAKIYVAGHRGLVGAALVRRLTAEGYTNIIGRTSKELDLTSQSQVADFFAREKPDYVFLAAAKVGGIQANNTYRAEFIYKNLMIQTNIIHQSWVNGVKKLLFLGSSCIYPRECPQPIREEYLLTGPLEPTNSPYAVAKIAGIEMCRAYNSQYGTSFIPVMPTNLYGPGDNFDLENSHVLPALIRKFHKAKQQQAQTVTVWGTGKPRREFLHVDDLAAACTFLMAQYAGTDLFNIGTGTDLSIKELAEIVAEAVGFTGKLVYDASKPDGTPQKLLDVTRINQAGWQARIPLKEGIKNVYSWYTQHWEETE